MLSMLRTSAVRSGSRLLVGVCAIGALAAAWPAVASAMPKNAYASVFSEGQVQHFTLGTSNTLTAGASTSAGGSGPRQAAITPNGKYLYVPDSNTSVVGQFNIASGGVAVALSPATASSGTTPWQVAVSPDGQNAYVTDVAGASVSVYTIGSGGTLSLSQTVTGMSQAYTVVVTPDGKSVYVGATGSGKIFEFNRSSSGTLTPKSTPSIVSGATSRAGLILTPNGKFLYEGSDSANILEFSVGTGGVLSALAATPSDFSLQSLVITPNGRNLYGSSCESDVIDQYSIASNGMLTPLSPSSVPQGGCGLPWMTADGGSFYAPTDSQQIDQFNISSTGALSPKSPASITVPATDQWGIVLPPDQGPIAKFSSKAGAAGKATSFNAKSSSAPDGTVARYDWNFGDGHKLTNGGATPKHTYKKPGKYKVTLTVTDDAGCSTALVFTGQTAYCNPGKSATHAVNIRAATVRRLSLSVTPNSSTAGKTVCYAFTVTSKGKSVKGSTVTLNGRHATTGSGGTARLCLKLRRGTHSARATKSGYRAATAAIRVAAAPVFTG